MPQRGQHDGIFCGGQPSRCALLCRHVVGDGVASGHQTCVCLYRHGLQAFGVGRNQSRLINRSVVRPHREQMRRTLSRISAAGSGGLPVLWKAPIGQPRQA
jgi:hypothetical protein